MELLIGLLTAGSGGLVGGALGFITNWFKAKEDAEKLQATRDFEVLKWEREDRLFELEMQRDSQDHEQEVEIVQQQGSWKSLGESVRAESTQGQVTYPWVVAIIKLYRPTLTTILILLAGYVFHVLTHQGLSEFLTPSEAAELVVYVVQSIIFAATTAASWWFADRALTPPHRKDR